MGGRGGACNRIFLAVGGEEPDENLVLKMAEERARGAPRLEASGKVEAFKDH